MKSEILILIAFFAMIFGIVYLLIRLKERSMLIRNGANATIFDSSKQPSSLKLGMVLVGIGTGILLGKVLSLYTMLDEELAIFSMICLCGGIGLILYHQVARKFEGIGKN
jgi:hypothetical protein